MTEELTIQDFFPCHVRCMHVEEELEHKRHRCCEYAFFLHLIDLPLQRCLVSLEDIVRMEKHHFFPVRINRLDRICLVRCLIYHTLSNFFV